MSFFAAAKMVLTLSCDESTRLVSESLDRQLPRGERLAVKLHAFCCRPCRRFRKQIDLLRTAIRRRCDEGTTATLLQAASLGPEARERIKQALAHAGHDKSS